MQFCQPGFNFGQPFVFNTPPSPCNGFPEIIGEGNVTSFMLPDGNVQFLFFPTNTVWKPSYPCTPNNSPNFFQPKPLGAWIIRSILNPLQQPLFGPSCNPSHIFGHPCNTQCQELKPPTCTEIFNSALPQNNYRLKFHHDVCTSTSDIHYFYPKLRQSSWYFPPKSCASIQVDTPINKCEIVRGSLKKPECVKCHKISSSASSMSVVSSKESLKKHKKRSKKPKREKSSTSCCSLSTMSVASSRGSLKKHKKHSKKSKSKKSKRTRNKKSQTSMSCDSGEDRRDKCVVTYADKACKAKERGQVTQTNSCGTIPVQTISKTDKNPLNLFLIKSSHSGTCCCHTTSDSE